MMTSNPLLPMIDALGRLIGTVHRVKAHLGTADGVEFGGLALMVRLMNSGPARACDLASSMAQDPAMISRHSHHLVDLGLVERLADPNDGRAIQLQVTPAGAEMVRSHLASRNSMFAEAIGHWSDADKEALTALVQRLTTDLDTQMKKSH